MGNVTYTNFGSSISLKYEIADIWLFQSFKNDSFIQFNLIIMSTLIFK